MLKKYLEARAALLQKQLDDITARANASEDVAEVRSLTAQANTIREEMASIRETMATAEAEERNTIPANATLVNPGAQSFAMATEKRADVNPTESVEYREAFRRYVTTGEFDAAALRAGDANSTKETGAAIPLTIMNEVINTVRKRYGNLYNKVRKTSVAGGVEIPVGSLQASFRWVTEKTTAPRDKAGDLGSVIFKYNQAEVRIATTWFANLLTLSAFETEITKAIAIAYLQAMDEAIVKGSGQGAPLGILNDTRVTGQAGHVIGMTAANMSNWKDWRKNFFAKLPLGYRGGEFIFALSTVETYLETMSDDNNNPVFYQATGLTVQDGDSAFPGGRFFGRDISLVEPDILPDFDTAEANDIIGIYWQPEEYCVNENFGFTMRRHFDDETNEWVDKALTVVDGKVVNPCGYYLIKKTT